MYIRSIPILCVAVASFTACGGDTADTTDVTAGGYAGEAGETSIAKGGSTLASSKSTRTSTGGVSSNGGSTGASSEPSSGGLTGTEPTANGGATATAGTAIGGATATQPSGGSSAGGITSAGGTISAGGTTNNGNTKTGGNNGKGGTSSSALGGTSATGTTTTAGGTTTSSGGTIARGGTSATGGASATATTSTCAVTYYRDADGDTWGGTVTSCAGGTGWVTRTGDCNDANVNVFPSQSTTFAEGYATGASSVSFDYNCDGEETTTGSVRESSGTCTASTSGTSCSGDGYLPVAPERAGTNLNQLCGSTLYLACTRSQQQCIETLFTDDTYAAVRCR